MKPTIFVECIVCNKTLGKIVHDPRQIGIEMGKITNRRSRTPNWSLEEKQYLLELIKRNKDVVVTKSNNGPNHSEEKDVVWNEILRQLIEKFGNKFSGFSIKKVKTQWQNMKRIAREEISNNASALQKLTRQSIEVFDILDLVKDGILKKENDNDNEPIIRTNVEIKSESIDEDISTIEDTNNTSSNIQVLENNNLSNISEQTRTETFMIDEENDFENRKEMQDNSDLRKSTNVMTETSFIENMMNTSPFHRNLQEFLRYSVTEKELKMESLKEERQVIRAMRETAELNKIIAEQKLKHILWMKKQEITYVI